MAWLSLTSLRTRLLLLVLLAVIPALGLTLYTNLEERRLRKVQVQEQAMRLIRLVSAGHERLIEDARQLLVTLARLPAVHDRSRAACSTLFADLLTQRSSYANLGVIGTDGDVFCSALPMTGRVYAGDRVYFRRAIETRDFAIGEYLVGRISGKPTLTFGYPVLDDGGHISAVVFVAVDLAWLDELASKAGLPPGTMLTVIDRNGTILSRYPAEGKWVGKLMPEPLVLKAILARQGNGTTEASGTDGIPRLFSFAPLGGRAQTANVYVSVGIPAAVAFAGINRILTRNLVALGLVAGLALAAAWVGGNLFIVRQIQALVAATKRVAAGELGVRTGLPRGQGELSHLASAFDQMAESLERNRQLTEALEHQTATGEILRVIASSPTDIQPVLDVVAASAARLCESNDAVIHRVDGDLLRRVAHYGHVPAPPGRGEEVPLSRGWIAGRAVVDRETIHVHNIMAELESEFPESKSHHERLGTRTILATPLLREDIPIGTIMIRRTEVRPFSEKQIALLKTFADQAVIAIENVRLFQELQVRNRDLTEALEQQTATGEVLRVIASSPTELQPVLDTLIANAVKLAGAKQGHIRQSDGEFLRVVAHYNESPERIAVLQSTPLPLDPNIPGARAFLDRKPIHLHDARLLAADAQFIARQTVPTSSDAGVRTLLSVPLLREGTGIGTITIWRDFVEPFTDRQIELVKTFADQAVIAIENVRLFQELKESLEQQTATSEILGVIASSPTDIQPVLDVVAENAARLCEAKDALIYRIDGDVLQRVAVYGSMPLPAASASVTRRNPVGRAVVDGKTIHVQDIAAEMETEFPESKTRQPITGARSMLATPLLREGIAIGAIAIRRTEVRPFSERHIALLKTFADQAVIAIENVRLFQQLEARTRELARSVEELRALGEVGQAVSSTLDLQTVLSTIVGHAVQLSGTNGGVIYEYDEAMQEFLLRASHRMEEELLKELRAAPIRLGEGAVGRAATSRAPVQVPDISHAPEYTARFRPVLARLGYRSILAVPLLREERIMGGLVVWRQVPGSFSEEVVNLLQTFATQSALAIQNARLFREIEEKSRQIEAANRHKSEFLANMSHELRTPLNAIIGFSEVLGERMFGELNEKQAEYTDDILSSGRHLLSLINEILDLSKVEAGRMELELATFDLPLAIDNARTFVRERATKHGINLDVTVDERLGDFVGDERKIKQILLNLLSNAVKFTPEEVGSESTPGKLMALWRFQSAIPASASPRKTRQRSSKNFARSEVTMLTRRKEPALG